MREKGGKREGDSVCSSSLSRLVCKEEGGEEGEMEGEGGGRKEGT
jgi:hypothetical protein